MDWFGFEIPATPVPAARPRVARTGHSYYPKKHTEYQQFLGSFFGGLPVYEKRGPVNARFLFVMPRYKTSDHPVRREDTDNLTKLPMDAMTKSTDELGESRFWVDDDMIVALEAYKRFVRDGEEPHTKIKMTTIEGSVEDYVDSLFERE